MALHEQTNAYDTGHLDTGDGHSIYYELSGNPQGIPVIFLHGGPGSGCQPGHRRFFDPAIFKVLLFDQRGCGKSQPAGGVENNTTAHLVADMERFREKLGCERWLVFGGSWGATLAMAYAKAHSSRVAGLILRGVFMARQQELAWFGEGAQRFLPDDWQDFIAVSPNADWCEAVALTHQAIFSGDDARIKAAADRWDAWESALMFHGKVSESSSPDTLDKRANRLKVQLHYVTEQCFLDDGELMRNLQTLQSTPMIIVQGRQDWVCPPNTAYELSLQLPQAKLVWVDGAGHGAFEPPIAEALCQAVNDIQPLLNSC